MRTLIIGDVHGHVNRLEALLYQEGIITKSGMRKATESQVIQLGDLGHYGTETKAQDRETWELAPHWLDTILWGNHDRATVSWSHSFGGYSPPFEETKESMRTAVAEGQLKLVHAAHGFLLTHAGLHACFKHLPVPGDARDSLNDFVEWMNQSDQALPDQPIVNENSFVDLRDSIGRMRGGSTDHGGILWRDARESLYGGFPQIFGHTAKDTTCRTYEPAKGIKSYCIDVGDRYNGRLMGVWLPEIKVVEVKLDERA